MFTFANSDRKTDIGRDNEETYRDSTDCAHE